MAYYSEELIDEVLTQTDIVEIISGYVSLKKRGRNFLGLCPFHREKTPSFIVSGDKQIFKCFGCGQGGNVISFISKIENLEFWESIEFLAERANIDLSKFEQKTSKSDKNLKEKKDSLYDINAIIANYYHETLITNLNEKSNLVKDYVIKRNFDMKTLKKFGIGYANNNNLLNNYLLEKGFSQEQILDTGVIVKKDNGKYYDRFYSRLIFPIFDVRDRVIGFGGRVLDKSLPKYVNSPENSIYVKGKHLYALNFAKKEKLDNIIITEGYMDTIALHKSGFCNTVASLGTALTQAQAKLLKKYTDNIIIAYDADGAGTSATLRGLDILATEKLNVKVLILDKSDVKDPDEYINKYKEERFKLCLDKSISLVEFKIKNYESDLDLNSLDSKIKFLTNVANILSEIDNNIERELYVEKISKKYNIAKGPILKEIDKKLQTVTETTPQYNDNINEKRPKTFNLNIKKQQEQYIIALFLTKDKSIQKKIIESLKISDIEDISVKDIYLKILELSEKYDINNTDIITKIDDEKIINELAEIMYMDISNIDKDKLLNDILKSKQKERYIKRREDILARISQNISKDELQVLQFELNQIILELSKLK